MLGPFLSVNEFKALNCELKTSQIATGKPNAQPAEKLRIH